MYLDALVIALNFIESVKMNDIEISEISPVRWDAKEMNIPGPEGTSSPGLNWTLNPTYHNRFLRVQDIMIYRLIMACKWTRPIYFAATVSDLNQMGLQNYLLMEGMTYRINFKEWYRRR